MCGESKISNTKTLQTEITFLLSLSFNSSLVRNAFKHNPLKARAREVNRAVWFAKTCKRSGNTIPIHALISGELPTKMETKRLSEANISMLKTQPLDSPVWASRWHRQSFFKISALSLTQFKKVIVVDNDMAMLRPVNELLFVPPPAAVFHTTIGPLQKRTRCSVTTGLLVLQPSEESFVFAKRLLKLMNYTKERYDGSDEEFWLEYFTRRGEYLNEIPWKFHAHRLLNMQPDQWYEVKLLHVISALSGRGFTIPKNATAHVEKYY